MSAEKKHNSVRIKKKKLNLQKLFLLHVELFIKDSSVRFFVVDFFKFLTLWPLIIYHGIKPSSLILNTWEWQRDYEAFWTHEVE